MDTEVSTVAVHGETVEVEAPATAPAINPNRPATAEDAAMLARVYARLNKAEKAKRDAESALRKGLAVWSDETDVTDLELSVETATAALVTELRACRAIIAGLPAGVTAKGGANRQTVVMQFYGAVNRDLGKRMTASDARKINSASFGG